MSDFRNGDRALVIVDDCARFRAFEGQWRALEGAGTEPNFFQSFAWSGHVAEVLSRELGDRFRPHVAIGLKGGEVTAIWPLARRRAFGTWKLGNLDQPFGQFAGVIAQSRDDALAIVEMTLQHVRQTGLAGSAVFERVIVGSALHAGLMTAGGAFKDATGAPYVRIAAFGTFDALKATRNKKTLKNLRNAANRMAREGTLCSTTLSDGPKLQALISRTLDNRTAWLQAAGRTAPSFRTRGHEEVLLGGEKWGLQAQKIGFDLTLGGASVAQQWGYLHNNRYYAYMSGAEADHGLTGVSLGGVQLQRVINACFAQGVAAVEFLTPASEYKMVWTDDAHALINASIGLSLFGAAAARLVDGGVRPLVKRGFHALPAGVRRRLVG